jgi:hypothetical protein
VPLPVRADGQRAERQDGVLADVPPGAQHVADGLARGGDRDQGQRREPGGAGPELVDQPGLGRDLARRLAWGEGGGGDGADDVGVALGLASDQHAVTMTRHRPGTQPDFAMTAAAAGAAASRLDVPSSRPEPARCSIEPAKSGPRTGPLA